MHPIHFEIMGSDPRTNLALEIFYFIRMYGEAEEIKQKGNENLKPELGCIHVCEGCECV